MKHFLLLSWFILANVGDFITTKMLLRTNLAVEANPGLHWLITTTHSIYSILVVKLIFIVLLFYGLTIYNNSKLTTTILTVLNIGLTLIVVRSMLMLQHISL